MEIGMARNRKIRPGYTYDSFYCTIDGWSREYHFGIKYPESWCNRKERSFNEWDRVEIFGKIRHHDRGRTTHRRPFESAEVWLHPIHTPRNEWEKDPKDIGGIFQASNGKLGVIIELAAGAYYSIIHSLSVNQFKQLTVHVRNLRYSRGSVDGIAFDPEETPPEDLH